MTASGSSVAGAVVADVAAAGPVAPASRFSRVRCTSCAMPVRGSEARCWSCGRDPTSAGGPAAPAPDGDTVGPKPPEVRRSRVVAVTLLVILVVAAGSAAVLVQGEPSHGVRGLAARLRGDGWQRAGIRDASAEFPATPVHEALPAGRGLPRAGGCLMAHDGGVRAELLVAEVADAGTLLDGSATADEIVHGFAAAGGGIVARRTPLYLDGAPGMDAVIGGGAQPVRVRVTVAGTTAYLLAVTGPGEVFERFTGSFRRSAAGAHALPPAG